MCIRDRPGAEQHAQAKAVDAGVVRDDGQVLDARIAKRFDQCLGDAAEAETADGKQLPVMDDAGERRGGAGEDLVHEAVSALRSRRLSQPRASKISAMTMDAATLQALSLIHI